jgi:PPOX class probable F420-dependent enzyme
MRLPSGEAARRFRGARVARLATVGADGAPHLVPVTFGVIDAPGAGDGAGRSDPAELIVFAVDHKPKSTTALRRLDNIAANPRVAFLVDAYADEWDKLWWVRADALAQVAGEPVRSSAIPALRAKYPQYERVPPTGVVVAATVTTWSGWQASPAAG